MVQDWWSEGSVSHRIPEAAIERVEFSASAAMLGHHGTALSISRPVNVDRLRHLVRGAPLWISVQPTQPGSVSGYVHLNAATQVEVSLALDGTRTLLLRRDRQTLAVSTNQQEIARVAQLLGMTLP